MYLVIDFQARKTQAVEGETELQELGFTAEEILTMLCGVRVRGCIIKYSPRINVIDPCTIQEICDLTGYSEDSVRALVRRALAKLKRRGLLRAFLEGIRGRRRVVIEVEE